MVTRSKTRAIQQAQNRIRSQRETSTRTSLQQPLPRVDEVVPQAHRPNIIFAGGHGQIQNEPAELEAALLAAINQVAADQDQADLAEAPADQKPVNEAVFDAAALERLVTAIARLNLMRTSCKIAWVYFRIATMACQASVGFQQTFASFMSFLPMSQLGSWLGAWPGTIALALVVLLLHLFNILCVRRSLTQESLAERVNASAAIFLGAGSFLKEKLEWMLLLQM